MTPNYLLSCQKQQVALLSASLQAEVERKKQLEEELQQSRDEVRSYSVTFDNIKISYFFTGLIKLFIKGLQDTRDSGPGSGGSE